MLENQRTTMRIRPALSPFLLAPAAALLLSASAFAAQPAATAPAAKPAAAKPAPSAPPATTAARPVTVTPVGVVPGEAINKMDQQTPAQREAMIKAMAEKLKKMSPAERKAFFEKNRAYYASLNPQQ